jgi:hypothetical protein
VCRNCGHDRKQHDFDDCCWQEINVNDQMTLCTCPGFQPIAACKSEQFTAEDWYSAFREAVTERDHNTFSLKLVEAERLIRLRIADVKPSERLEWQKLRDAIQTIRFLKTPF